ncbi:MAG: hypothetical protein Q8O88_04110 [bacterium]|nr:hypothetical protein [bacterium]
MNTEEHFKKGDTVFVSTNSHDYKPMFLLNDVAMSEIRDKAEALLVKTCRKVLFEKVHRYWRRHIR